MYIWYIWQIYSIECWWYWRCWFYAFDLNDVTQQAGYAFAQHQDLATFCLLVRGQVYVGGAVYERYVILYDHLSCILCIRQYADKFYCIPCCQTRKEKAFKPKNNNRYNKKELTDVEIQEQSASFLRKNSNPTTRTTSRISSG